MAEEDILATLPEVLRRLLGPTPHADDLDGEICLMSSDDPPFCVFFPPGHPPSEADAQFIARTLAQQHTHVARALCYMRQQTVFPEAADASVAGPQLFFRPGFEFDVFFQSCNLPRARNGLLIGFRQDQPVAIEPIEDGDCWWDEDTRNWIPS